MDIVSRTTTTGRRLQALAIFACAAALAVFAFAPHAFAQYNSSYPTRCDMCHNGAGDAPAVTLVSNDGTTATYSIAPNGMEWAVFNGSTRITGVASQSPAQFSVPVGSTYDVYDVYGYPGPLGVAHISPAGGTVATFTIMPSVTGGNGSISPSAVQVVNAGANATFTITPSAGYHVATLLVNGSPVAPATTYTFTNVTANSTIAATFAADTGGTVATFTITPSVTGGNGSISPSAVQVVNSGAGATFAITPSAGYHVATLLINGTSVTPATSYTFTNVTSNQTIAATFEVNPVSTTYVLTPSVSGGHGSIAPATAITVDAHGTYSFRLQPDVGYHVDKLLVDGTAVTVSLGGVYTLADITSDHAIVASFAAGALPGSYALLPTAGAHGTVGPAVSAYPYGPVITLLPNSTYTFRVKADLGYHIDTVLVDGVPARLTSGGLYTFTNVTATHTFAVTFAPNAPTAVKLKASSSSVTHGKYVTLSAVLSGGVPAGSKVSIQARTPGRSTYTTISSPGVSSSGAASKRYRLSKKGTYYFRVVYSGSASFAPSTSNSVKVKSK
jgi:hypothetical protein